MSDSLIGALITGGFMLAVALVTGLWARINKRTPEPTPIEKLWDRLDRQDTKIAAQDSTIEGLRREVGTLQEQVVAYRGGFLAQVAWAARVKEAWTGSIPIVTFTLEEEQSIRRGLDMAALNEVHQRRAED
jgi:hypothetical protein